MAMNPQLAMLFSQLIMNFPQLVRQAPILVNGIKNMISEADAQPDNYFPRDLASNSIAATQEAMNRGYDLGLLEENAKSWEDNLPMSIMEDPISGGGEGAVVDLNDNPKYISTDDGQIYPYMIEGQRISGFGNDLSEDQLQNLYKNLATRKRNY